jgi:cytochrome c2
MLRTLVLATVLVVSTNLTLAQDIGNGAIIFKKCAICHKIGPGATKAACRLM